MIKTVFTGSWVILVFAASLFVGGGKLDEFGIPQDSSSKTADDVQQLKLNPLSVAYVRNGSVEGYFIVEPAILYASNNRNKSDSIDLYLQDAVVGYLFNNKEIDPERLEKFDIQQFRKEMREALNSSIKGISVQEVLIQRLDYLSIEEVRDRKLRAG